MNIIDNFNFKMVFFSLCLFYDFLIIIYPYLISSFSYPVWISQFILSYCIITSNFNRYGPIPFLLISLKRKIQHELNIIFLSYITSSWAMTLYCFIWYTHSLSHRVSWNTILQFLISGIIGILSHNYFIILSYSSIIWYKIPFIITFLAYIIVMKVCIIDTNNFVIAFG